MSATVPYVIAMMSMILIAILAYLLISERNKTHLVRKFFGPEFMRALQNRNGLLFFIFDSSGDAKFRFIPYTHKDESFYYINYPSRSDEKIHFKVPKDALYRLHNQLNMTLVAEDSITGISAKALDILSDLPPIEKARFTNAYMKYHQLKNTRKEILQALRFATDPDDINKYKDMLEDIDKELQEIREKWEGILQEVDLDSTLILPDKDNKKLTILRPVKIESIDEFLEGTRSSELMYTAKRMFVDWQQMALESLKKIVALSKSRQTGMSLGKLLLFAGGGLIVLLILGMFASHL